MAKSIKIIYGIMAGCVLLSLVLGALKKSGVAPVSLWSWWYVTAPVWGPWAILLGLTLLCLALAGLFPNKPASKEPQV